MNIIKELNKRNINVIKTEDLYKGYYVTDKGIVITERKSKCEDGIYFLENDKGRVFPCNDQRIYITSGTEYDGKIKTIEEADRLADEGKIFSFKSSDLYSEYYNFKDNRDLECCFKYGYSGRSRAYIESVMNNIGFLYYTDAANGSMKTEGEPSSFEVICKYSVFLNAETEVGKMKSDLWIAQTCYQIGSDDFAVVKMYFNHKPSKSDIKTAFAIRRFEMKPIEVFRCCECGHLRNWLDLQGDISQKYNMAKEKYCGC